MLSPVAQLVSNSRHSVVTFQISSQSFWNRGLYCLQSFSKPFQWLRWKLKEVFFSSAQWTRLFALNDYCVLYFETWRNTPPPSLSHSLSLSLYFILTLFPLFPFLQKLHVEDIRIVQHEQQEHRPSKMCIQLLEVEGGH